MHLAAVLARVRLVGLGDHLRLAAQPHTGEVVAEHREPDRGSRDVGRIDGISLIRTETSSGLTVIGLIVIGSSRSRSWGSRRCG
jgi:hypothetical protein